jgi:UDP-N-acetylglucosamine 2-epimerase
MIGKNWPDSGNPFGDGGASERIAAFIKEHIVQQ